jgi:hypothetical protein
MSKNPHLSVPVATRILQAAEPAGNLKHWDFSVVPTLRQHVEPARTPYTNSIHSWVLDYHDYDEGKGPDDIGDLEVRIYKHNDAEWKFMAFSVLRSMRDDREIITEEEMHLRIKNALEHREAYDLDQISVMHGPTLERVLADARRRWEAIQFIADPATLL